ncbi:MAG: hypothetical protein EOM17_11385, partial [Synergistales bacterium]|nr:hypothetical protein [Synergistales bacterium]
MSEWSDLGLPTPNSQDYSISLTPGLFRTPFPTFKADQKRRFRMHRKSFRMTVELDRTQLKTAEDFLRLKGYARFSLDMKTSRGRLVETSVRLIEPYRVAPVGFRTYGLSMVAETIFPSLQAPIQLSAMPLLSLLSGRLVEPKTYQIFAPPLLTSLQGQLLIARTVSAIGRGQVATTGRGEGAQEEADCGEFSEFSLLHLFSYDDPTNGSYPYGDLTLVGDTLYGMTPFGGANDTGIIFSVGVDGSNFTLLHSFGTSGEPYGSLTLVGSLLYGMTSWDFGDEMGVIFSIALDGSNFTVVHEFQDNNPANGSSPYGNNLIVVDGELFGMTQYGGAYDAGTIFSIGQDGTNFTVIHSFQFSNESNGGIPFGSPTLVGTRLFGMTLVGGEGGEGVVFSIGKDGSGFTIHHSFGEDQGYPWGSLILVGDALYGMTSGGGENEEGTIFSIGSDGNNYTLLHSFGPSGAPDNGSDVFGDLIFVNGTLYGMTYSGGANDLGIIFSIQPDGSEFTIVHSFSEETSGHPWKSLIYSDCVLYGMT